MWADVSRTVDGATFAELLAFMIVENNFCLTRSHHQTSSSISEVKL